MYFVARCAARTETLLGTAVADTVDKAHSVTFIRTRIRRMTLAIHPLHALFAAELLGADLHEPPSRELIAAVNQAMAQFAVVVIRDQKINDEEQIRFSRAFGPLELPPHMGMKTELHRRIRPELYDVSNLDP